MYFNDFLDNVALIAGSLKEPHLQDTSVWHVNIKYIVSQNNPQDPKRGTGPLEGRKSGVT